MTLWSSGKRANSAGTFTVRARELPAGGSLGTPVDVSVSGENAYDAQLAANPAGDAAVVWLRRGGGITNDSVRAATFVAGVGFGAPVGLSPFGYLGGSGGRPEVAVDQVGDAIAIWAAFGTSASLQAAAIATVGSPVPVRRPSGRPGAQPSGRGRPSR